MSNHVTRNSLQPPIQLVMPFEILMGITQLKGIRSLNTMFLSSTVGCFGEVGGECKGHGPLSIQVKMGRTPAPVTCPTLPNHSKPPNPFIPCPIIWLYSTTELPSHDNHCTAHSLPQVDFHPRQAASTALVTSTCALRGETERFESHPVNDRVFEIQSSALCVFKFHTFRSSVKRESGMWTTLDVVYSLAINIQQVDFGLACLPP